MERLKSGNRDLRLHVDSGLEFGASLDVDAVLRTVAERILAVSDADCPDVFGEDGTNWTPSPRAAVPGRPPSTAPVPDSTTTARSPRASRRGGRS